MKSKSLIELLPGEYSGWEKTGEDNFYDNDTLYNYIDGGAELYLSYGFYKVLSRSYNKNGMPEIKVDVFDMINSRNAYGVYTHSREHVENDFGQGSQTLIGAVLFWKNIYYISIMAQSDEVEVKKAIHGIARYIDSEISEQGKIPNVIGLLPKVNLVPESVTYFHHPVWLNHYAWLFEDNYLNINSETSCVWAKYDTNSDRTMLLLVQYKDKNTVLQGFESFNSNLFKGGFDEKVKYDKYNKWMSCRVSDNLFAAVFKAPAKDIAVSLLDLVFNKD